MSVKLLERNRNLIDALNVYPVPDGDTGTNMLLTLSCALEDTGSLQTRAAGEVAAAVATATMKQARGNSGLILSQVFSGIAMELRGKTDFGAVELAAALNCASEYAYRALGSPVEGTMLTVIRGAAEAAREGVDAGHTVSELMDAICAAARHSVSLTPTMLPVLRDAGVVDAGGHGLSVLLEGIRIYVSGEEIGPGEIPAPKPIGAEASVATVSESFLEATDEKFYGYCTQFLIEGGGLDPDAVRDRMMSLGQSTVVVGDETMVKVHVHARDPGLLLSEGVSFGTLSQVKIENMDEQHREYSLARRREAAVPAVVEERSVGVVAVAWGDGLENLFASLGASEVLRAGDTMNPSVQEIVDAVEATRSGSVIFLPNNRNIVPAAKQAMGLTDKRLAVVPSTSIPQGVAAILSFNPDRDIDQNVLEMERTLSTIRTGDVCKATRSVLLNGVSVEEGQIIGLLERRLVVAGETPREVLIAVLGEANVQEGELITLYWGGDLTEEEVDKARDGVERAFPNIGLEVVQGGQPYYFYIVSIE